MQDYLIDLQPTLISGEHKHVRQIVRVQGPPVPRMCSKVLLTTVLQIDDLSIVARLYCTKVPVSIHNYCRKRNLYGQFEGHEVAADAGIQVGRYCM